MTQPQQVQIIPRAPHHEQAQLGAALSSAGFSSAEIAALLMRVDQRAREMVHELLPDVIAMAQRAHVNACAEIERRIWAAQVNILSTGGRATFAAIARQVANEGPRYSNGNGARS